MSGARSAYLKSPRWISKYLLGGFSTARLTTRRLPIEILLKSFLRITVWFHLTKENGQKGNTIRRFVILFRHTNIYFITHRTIPPCRVIYFSLFSDETNVDIPG